MKLKEILIALVITSLSISLYYLPQSLKSLYNMLSMIGREPMFSMYVINQVISNIFTMLGIAGVVLYFVQNQNIYNKLLKIYLIQHTVSLAFALPSRLIWIFAPPSASEYHWYYHLFYAISIATAVLAVMVYSKQKVRVLPAPVASNSVRFLHYFVDTIFLNVLAFGSSFFFLNSYDSQDEGYLIVGYILLFFFPMVYYTICEAGFKQTVGKVLTGAYVSSEKGTNPGIGRILGRSLCRYIPFEAFSYLPDPMSKWHDKFSGTDVFYKSNVDFEDTDDFIADHLVSKDDYI